MNIIETIQLKLLFKQVDDMLAAYPFKSRCKPPSPKRTQKSAR